MIIAGIDPGFTGAIAFLDIANLNGFEGVWRITSAAIATADMPTLSVGNKKKSREELDLRTIVSLLRPCSYAFLEKAQPMPGQGISSTSRYMASWGMLQGVLATLAVPYTLVHPVVWKSEMMAGMPKEKSASILRVSQLFPEVELPRKKDHGKADAILIACWGLKQLINVK